MKIAISIFILLTISSAAHAEPQKGFRCTTIQTFLWPIKNPHGNEVEHTVRVTMESYAADSYLAKISSAQSAWKTCRAKLGQQFNKDWQEFGLERAPMPKDEFEIQRPPRICETIYRKPNLFFCTEVTRDVEPNMDPIVLIEATILK